VNAKIVSALSLLVLAAPAAQAQQTQVISDRVAKSMPTRYDPPQCELKSGHFKVSSGATYLKTGIETDVPENKRRVWESGRKVLLEAIEKNGQAQNGAAWYYLGRIYLVEGDVTGADTAVAKAVKLAPQCAKDLQNYVQNGWAALMRAGNDFEEKKNLDSAMVMYRQAALLNPSSPVTHYYMARVLSDQGQQDSAATHYGLAAKAAEGTTDTAMVKVRNQSAFNEGAIYLNAKKYPQAIAAFERYLQWVPNDAEAKRGLAGAYRAAGQPDKAQVLEKELVAAGAAGGGAGAAGGGAGTQDLMTVGINLYNDKKYSEAAAAFEQVVAAEPYDRDALFNLANTYLAMKDGAKLLPTAEKLAAIEPMNETAVKMVGEGYKQTKKVDEAVKVAEKVLAMPVDIKVTNFAATGSGATWTATATGRAAQTASGKPLPPAPVTLTVEFIDAKGTVVSTQDAAIPALKANAAHELKVQGQGAGIAGWRYKQK
jgi:tetratricopeptide (TPR) repeat protein